jgi:hypothetical protein
MGAFDFLKKNEFAEISRLRNEVKELNQKLDELKQYEVIVDAVAEAEKIKAEAQLAVKLAEEEAKKLISDAQKAAEEITNDAKEIQQKATLTAETIINEAQKKAEEIAGDAYKAQQNAAEYEKTVKALKNVIDGYGDRYVVPTQSLLDDLAAEFGHLEAGQKLKEARESTRLMIQIGSAAKCDYAEINRRDTAIKFVLDAFNGKVDSILSNVKKDNYGTLSQKIKDAFQIVNSNGRAFRNAEITPQYMSSRLEELRWAVVAQALKWNEQEEQRRIKEQIREEEKAKREYEKALREAEKEEATLKKLIEKAQSEMQQASEAQRTKYEERLKEYEEKLKEAEERGQRALSMAQQTKSGNVYIISNIGSFGEDVYKIGMTRRLEPLDRVKELGDASVPFEFDVHAMIYSEDAPGLETFLHKKYLSAQVNKVNPRKEFFKLPITEIRSEIEKLGLETKWTMTAEAKQYRETLAIEREIMTDENKRLEWEKAQAVKDVSLFAIEKTGEE